MHILLNYFKLHINNKQVLKRKKKYHKSESGALPLLLTSYRY